jgi:hypothetical protein
MSCAIRFIRPVFFVRWDTPTKHDLPRIQVQLEEAYKENEGPVVYVAIVPDGSSPPDDDLRAEFIGRMAEVLDRCDTMHFVIEGEGFKHAVVRTSLATILLVRGQRTKVFVHRSLDDALTAAAKKMRFSAAAITRHAREAGLVTSSEARSAAGR